MFCVVNKKRFVTDELVRFCSFPVPRTRSEIAAHLVSVGQYKSRSDRVADLIAPLLDEACGRGILVAFSPEGTGWNNARQVVKDFAKRRAKKTPRKLSRLYQTNFLCLAETPGLAEFPTMPDLNVELVTFLYRFVREKPVPGFFWNLLNLFLAYSAFRDRIRLKVHALRLAEGDEEALLRALEQSFRLKNLLEQLPFLPNVEKAEGFLDLLAE